MEQTIILDKDNIIGIAYDKNAEKFYKDKGYELKKVHVLQADMYDIKDVIWKVRKTWKLYEDAGDIQDEGGDLELFKFEIFSISRNVSREELKEYLNTLYFADECPCLDGMY